MIEKTRFSDLGEKCLTQILVYLEEFRYLVITKRNIWQFTLKFFLVLLEYLEESRSELHKKINEFGILSQFVDVLVAKYTFPLCMGKCVCNVTTVHWSHSSVIPKCTWKSWKGCMSEVIVHDRTSWQPLWLEACNLLWNPPVS